MAQVDPDSTPGIKGRKKALEDLKAHQARLFKLQERLFAEHKLSLLVVLQAMDTGGKDGTITHVIGGMNPQAVRITAFKQPTPQEKRHGFLWRIRRNLPESGFVGIFNRSHYEDVLVARVHGLAPPEIIERRYGVINRFEKDVTKGHDIDERAYWDDYQSAYSLAIDRCSTRWAPWYVIPANDKDYRNWAVARILIETLEEMDPQYPHPKLDVPRLIKRLQA